MTDKIMMDGEPLEVGDEVFCLHRGEGVVEGICRKHTFPILVYFKLNSPNTYDENFSYRKPYHRTLYRQKPEIVPPPKPKKRVKVWDWFVEWDDGLIKRLNAFTEHDVGISTGAYILQKIDGTEREIEV